MAVVFASASTQYLQNSAPPAFAYPFTVAMWTLPGGLLANRTFWVWSDNTTTNNYFEIGTTGAGATLFNAQAGASLATTNTTGSTGQAIYIIARVISATEKRLASMLSSTGVIGQANTATNVTPTGLNTMALGARIDSGGASRAWDGRISEFWWTSNDVGLGGGNLDASLIRRLAREGPFSVPHVADNLVEYRSFRNSLQAPGGDSRETYFGEFGSQVWSSVNGPTLQSGAVALSSLYARPLKRNNLRRFMPEMMFGTASASHRRRRLIVIG